MPTLLSMIPTSRDVKWLRSMCLEVSEHMEDVTNKTTRAVRPWKEVTLRKEMEFPRRELDHEMETKPEDCKQRVCGGRNVAWDQSQIKVTTIKNTR
jgi:hypothetical protein